MKRVKHIKYISIVPTPHADRIEIAVSYDKGGMNFFTGQPRQRGYYLDAQPMSISDGFTSFLGFSGVTELIMPAARYSAKVLDSIVPDEAQVKRLVDYVVKKGNLTLA